MPMLLSFEVLFKSKMKLVDSSNKVKEKENKE